ncbi:MAG: MFS transporter [Pseudomonadota bacterium]
MITVDVDERIDASPIGALQSRIVAICFVLALIDGFDAQAIAFVAPLLKAEFSIGSAQMGVLFAAALAGLMVGAFVFSPLADRFGRKPVIFVSCAIMGAFALLTAVASSLEELLIYRFLTGVGLGGVMPQINTLTSEFAPARRRAFLMTTMFIGFPVGAVLGGLVSNLLIQKFGWQSVFILGGVAPLLMLPVVALSLPESIRFLAISGRQQNAITKLLSQIDRSIEPDEYYQFSATGGQQSTRVIVGLFSGGRGLGTLLIWTIVFASLLTMYSLMSWLPSVMTAAGLPLEDAILTAVTLNLGGVIGGLLIAAAIDRQGPFGVLAAVFLLGAFAIALIGQSAGHLPLAFTAVFVSGAAVIGGQLGMNALVVRFYPTEMRATGLGWALAVGRIGSIIGPIVVGFTISLGWSLQSVFILAAIPAFLCAGVTIILQRLTPLSTA